MLWENFSILQERRRICVDEKKSRADKDRRRWCDSADQWLLFRSGVPPSAAYLMRQRATLKERKYELLLDYREGSVAIAAYYSVIAFG